jgi:membrane protein DedA with SNARE-associated domain
MFILYDLIGVLAWSAFYLVLGAVFGSSYEILKNVMNDFQFFGGIFALLVIVPLIAARIFRKKLPEIVETKQKHESGAGPKSET